MWRSIARAAAAAAVLVLAASSCSHQCDAESCPDGCCDEDGICWVNPSDVGDSHCGLGGAACQQCSYRQSCVSGTCCGGRDADCSTAGDCCAGLSCISSYAGYRKCGSCVQAGSHCETDADCCAGGNLRCWEYNNGDTKCACLPAGYACDTSSDCCPGTTCRWDAGYGASVCG